MDHGHTRLFRHRLRQPFDQPFDFIDPFGFGATILFGPSIDLTLEIIARFAMMFKADFLVIEIMQPSERTNH